MARYYIIRDQDGYGDVALVWNWRKRDWCWDLDGYYNAEDGFAYSDMRTAADRARAVMAQEAEMQYRYGKGRRVGYTGVRVVDRQGMLDALDAAV